MGISFLPKLFTLIDDNFLGIPQTGTSSIYYRKVPFNNTIDKKWCIEKQNRVERALYFPPHSPPEII